MPYPKAAVIPETTPCNSHVLGSIDGLWVRQKKSTAPMVPAKPGRARRSGSAASRWSTTASAHSRAVGRVRRWPQSSLGRRSRRCWSSDLLERSASRAVAAPGLFDLDGDGEDAGQPEAGQPLRAGQLGGLQEALQEADFGGQSTMMMDAERSAASAAATGRANAGGGRLRITNPANAVARPITA